jgi:hypothetical protein
MTQLSCTSCRLRLPRGTAAPGGRCPRCSEPLGAAALEELVGSQVWHPADDEPQLPEALADAIALRRETP